MQEYVAGFLFQDDGYDSENYRFDTKVALITKLKPEWQKGLLNGIGGKVEPGETPLEAMIREFKEEAGATITRWQQFATMNCGGNREGVIHFFTAINNVAKIKTMEKEEVAWYDVNYLPGNTVPNLRFLVPMALNQWQDDYDGEVFKIKQEGNK